MLKQLKAGLTATGLATALTLSLVATAFAQSPATSPSGMASPSASPAGKTSFRVVHAVPDAQAVDVYVDDKRALAGVTFKRVTGYMSYAAGRHTVKVYQSTARGAGTAMLTQDVDFNNGWDYTLAVVGQANNAQVKILSDNLNVPGTGKANVRVYHFSPNAPAVNVAVKGGDTLTRNLSFPNATDYLQVDSKAYSFEVQTASDSKSVLNFNATFPSNAVESVFVFRLANGQPALSALTVRDRIGASSTPATGANDSFGFMVLVAGLVAATGVALKKIAIIQEQQ
jgi:hypothetical protein